MLPGGGWACPNPPAETISDRRSLTPSRVRRCSRKPRRSRGTPSRISRPSAYTQLLVRGVVNPVVHLEHSALGSTRRRSHRRQPDEALVEDEGAHGERRSGRDDGDERRRSEHDEAPATTAVACTGTAQHVVPVGRAGRGGKDAIEAAAVEIGHVRTSSSRVRSAACAALRVAATVPVLIPSASPIAA